MKCIPVKTAVGAMGNPLWKYYAVCRKRVRECRTRALLLLRRLSDKDREFRAERLAEMTVHAALSGLYKREMIPFNVKSTRHFQHVARAVFDAELASFATLLNNSHGAPAYMDFFRIKGRAPEFHRVFFPEVSGLNRAGYVQPLWKKISKKGNTYTIWERFLQPER
jgi:hypothetical protein